jgi:hypothetical protein
MPVAQMGEKISGVDKRNKFISLSAKDEGFLLRFVGGYAYEGKHFKQKEDLKWIVTDCERINNEGHCDTCETYFDMMKPVYEMKKLLKAETDKKKKAELEFDIKTATADAAKFKVKISFYYPVLKRVTDLQAEKGAKPEATVFKTSLSIRLKLDEEIKKGYNVSDFDYLVMRTEKPGSGYYELDRQDSSKTKPLTDEEKLLIKEATAINLESLLSGGKSGKTQFAATTDTEVEEPKSGEPDGSE